MSNPLWRVGALLLRIKALAYPILQLIQRGGELHPFMSTLFIHENLRSHFKVALQILMDVLPFSLFVNPRCHSKHSLNEDALGNA